MLKLEDILVKEEEEYIIINKPVGVLSIPDRFDPNRLNIFGYLKRIYPEIYSVHRLDKETSGILIYARTKEMHKYLSKEFEDRNVDKYYLALVNGIITDDSGLIDKKIDKDKFRPGRMIISNGGKESKTEYRVVERFNQVTLVEAKLLTGRTHQIRVHFQALGHPLLIDPDYGGKEAFYISSLKGRKFNLSKYLEEKPVMSRVTLHAWRLSFLLPQSGEVKTYEVEPPKDFRALVHQMRKWNK